MLCDDCHKNEASIHITQISAEGRLEKNLCGTCAVRYGDLTMRPETEDVTVHDFLKVVTVPLMEPGIPDANSKPFNSFSMAILAILDNLFSPLCCL